MGEVALSPAVGAEGRDAASVRLLCLLPSIPLGGMERAVIRLVAELTARGAEAHFAAERRWGHAVQREIEAIGARWTGVPFVASLSRPRTAVELGWALRSYARSPSDLRRVFEARRPRQLLATNINNAFFARGLARLPEVVSVFRAPNPPGVSRNGLKRAFDRAVWRTVHSAYDAIVCNSDYTAGRIAATVGDDRGIEVVRNLPPALGRGADDLPPPDPSRRRIVFLGQISRHKGVDVLVEAATGLIAHRQDVDLVLAGPDVWQDGFGAQIRAGIVEAGLGERIRFLGPVGDVHALLGGAAVHVCPSTGDAESFPNVVIEAKQAGVPSVVFPTAGLPEAVEDGVSGLVTAAPTAAALRHALGRVLDEPGLRARLAEGAARSLQEYSPDRITDRWLDLLVPARPGKSA